MKSLGIAWKINCGLLLTILVSVSLLAFISQQGEKSSVAVTQLLSAELKQQLVAREAQVHLKKQVQEWKNILLRGHDSDDMDKYLALFLEEEKQVLARASELRSLSKSSATTALLDEFITSSNDLSAAYRSAIAFLQEAPNQNQRQADTQVRGKDRAPTDLLDELVDAYDTQVDTLIAGQIKAEADQARYFMLLSVIGLGIAMLVFSLVLNKRLVVPLKQLVRVASQLSEDDNKVNLPCTDRGDEIGDLARALETFRRNRITGLALQRSAELAIEERELVKQNALKSELATERAASEDREKAHTVELAEEAGKREKQLRSRIQRLSEAVHAAAHGDLKYLAAHPESEARPDDDLGSMTTDLENLFGQFDRDFTSISLEAGTLNEAATHLGELGRSINDGAQMNTLQTQQVLEGAVTVKEALLQVATNIKQMDTGIRGIAGSAEQASGVATHAVELARSTDATMRQLSESSTDIGNVIKLITSVAEQTNLLALNATIEAARAGEAGKGFAVVANEVKELAKETNKATDEIERRISAIRGDTDNAVEAIASINSIVSEIDDIQASISQAVQEQSDAAQVITELVSNTTGDNKTVRELIADVAERQQVTQSSAAEVQKASDQLRDSARGNIELTARYAA